jgi:hypothetical protein
MKRTMTQILAWLMVLGVGDLAVAAPPDLGTLDKCKDSLDVAIFISPKRPNIKMPIRVLVVSEKNIGDAEIVALDPKGVTRTLTFQKFGGPPYGWVATIDKPTRGRWKVGIGSGARIDGCQKLRVGRHGRMSNGVPEGTIIDPIWRSRIKWERDTENLYSLWIERLFDAPLAKDVSWNPMHVVTRDASRNLLYNHLGFNEDKAGSSAMKLKPDCADFPYFLRGYFAWKMGLPFAFRGCRRGNAKRPPRCGDIASNHMASDKLTRTGAFGHFIRRKVGGTVHSSSLRALPLAEKSDFYPVKLTRLGLRPGTIYADPYGHTLMVGKWIPQKGDTAGVLLAIDAQPDGIIGRRVFWKGSFLFPEDNAVKGSGFKRFRPVRRTRNGHIAFTNEQITKSIDYGDFSVEQWAQGKESFYERMDELISPIPLPPEKALVAYIDALDQQMRRRVESVEGGEEWKRKRPKRTMKMPQGPAIFITSGAWESYSTPSRDLRLLIAIDTVRDFPKRVAKFPKRFRIAPGTTMDQVKASIEAVILRESKARKFTYKRSDGSPWTLTMHDIMSRTTQFEMAYNPNDCIEIRWGATEGSDEASTCKRRAPAKHRKWMASYRDWFKRRIRPQR